MRINPWPLLSRNCPWKEGIHFTIFQRNFYIKYHLDCQSQYVIYLLECICGAQYVGRTTQKLQTRINKQRAYIRRGFLQHSVSRHVFTPSVSGKPYKVTPSDHIPPSTINRFECIQRMEMYWMFQLWTLQPEGLYKATKLIG